MPHSWKFRKHTTFTPMRAIPDNESEQETSATATNLGVALETRPSYAAELAPADPKITRKPLIKVRELEINDVKAKTTMGDDAREERNQLARQDASVSTFNRRSPLGSESVIAIPAKFLHA
ncbi:hypothetical protein Y032_0094g2732 [Ancylostoma ceylanicum]|uniref:Uncharacterized protein n=2 Tax=Ancylostoma ceylanicum TaxID=53326 RepID=A0A016TLE3_9BILA|nr:hypothetical protein Y032_0094g2732 [Ancylostoma ceylanicum]